MSLITGSHARERILLMGGFGSGKSRAHQTLWHWLTATQTPAKIFVIDTDNAVDRAADELGDQYLTSITHQPAWDWDDFLKVEAWRQEATRDDWLVIDRIEKAWQLVQDWYVGKVYGKDSAQFFLEYKMSTEKGGSPLADAHGSNWDVINKNYRAWMMQVQRWPGHVLVCTDVKPVDRGNDDATTISTFGPYGKPAGQKDLGKEFHSILLLAQPAVGRWTMTTVRDRNRAVVQGAEVSDWVAQYLMQIGGWRQDAVQS